MPFVDYKEPEEEKHCVHPEHDPPNMIVLKPGTYTYKCPACGAVTVFRVSGHHLINETNWNVFQPKSADIATNWNKHD